MNFVVKNMEKYKLFDAEYKFVSIIWDNEPTNSTKLVKLRAEKFGWKNPLPTLY